MHYSTQGPKALVNLAPSVRPTINQSPNPSHFMSAGQLAIGVRAGDLALSK